MATRRPPLSGAPPSAAARSERRRVERRHREERVVVERRRGAERREGAPTALPGAAGGGPPVLPPGVPEEDLARGMRGAAVSALQRLLGARGLLTETAVRQEAGRLGEATLAALQALQRQLEVPATGFYGPLTREALAREVAQGGGRARRVGR